MLKDILTEENILGICLDNITKIDGEDNNEAFKYVAGYVLINNPDLDEEQVILKVNEMIAEKILNNLIDKNYIEIDWETNTCIVNTKGREYYRKALDATLS